MAPKEGNVKDGEPIPEGLATGPYFYFRQLLGLLVTTLGVVFSIVCFDQYYYGMSNLLVTWTGLIVSVGGLIIHETRPYKVAQPSASCLMLATLGANLTAPLPTNSSITPLLKPLSPIAAVGRLDAHQRLAGKEHGRARSCVLQRTGIKEEQIES